MNSIVISARESKILIEKNNHGIEHQGYALTACMVSIGALILCIVIGILTLKLRSRRIPTKLGYAQADFRNPPQPPVRGGLFSGFARRPVSPVD